LRVFNSLHRSANHSRRGVKREVAFDTSPGLSAVSPGLRVKSHDLLCISTLEELRLKGLVFARFIGGLRFADISNRRLWDACKCVDLPTRVPLSLNEPGIKSLVATGCLSEQIAITSIFYPTII
jgi:hypothetical protein